MNFIACNRHPEQNIQFLCFLPNDIGLLCEDCVEEGFLQGQQLTLDKLISLKTLLNKPEIIIKRLYLNKELQHVYKDIGLYNQSYLNEQIIEMEKQAQNLQQQIQEMLQKFKTCVQNIDILRKQFQQDFIGKFNLDSLKRLLNGLVKSEDATAPDVINQLKLKLHQCCIQLQKEYKRPEEIVIIFNQIYETSKRVDLEIQKLQPLDQLQLKLNQFHKYQQKIATSLYPSTTKQYISSTLFTSYQQYKIINFVKENQECQFQDIKLIFLGSRDGLNAQSFWTKVNGKKNLLMIFKSKSNYIFGGYSPCQWQQNSNNYVSDNTNSSFLFSQTHDEIYPIVNNQYAIYCKSDLGPTFGNGHDINIRADFQGGCSNLGTSYKQGSKFKNQYKTELFGQSTPTLIECEIFEIIAK